MEIINARVVAEEKEQYLLLELTENPLKIALTENKPNEVKSVFNNLILQIKKKDFRFELLAENQDLYTLICKEYIKQLNQEIQSIRQEMIDSGLINLEN